MSNRKKYADEIFKTHENISKIGITSDGCGFTEEFSNHAEAHAATLQDKDVEWFERENASERDEDIEPGAAERNALVARYMYFFDAKPAETITTDELKAIVAAEEEKIQEENEEKKKAAKAAKK